MLGQRLEDVLVVFLLGLSVVLFVKVNLYLFQKWLAEDANWDILMLLEKDNEMLQHFLPHIKVGVTVHQNESQGLVKNWGELVSFASEAIE